MTNADFWLYLGLAGILLLAPLLIRSPEDDP
jgi:hypothetical protein